MKSCGVISRNKRYLATNKKIFHNVPCLVSELVFCFFTTVEAFLFTFSNAKGANAERDFLRSIIIRYCMQKLFRDNLLQNFTQWEHRVSSPTATLKFDSRIQFRILKKSANDRIASAVSAICAKVVPAFLGQIDNGPAPPKF